MKTAMMKAAMMKAAAPLAADSAPQFEIRAGRIYAPALGHGSVTQGQARHPLHFSQKGIPRLAFFCYT